MLGEDFGVVSYWVGWDLVFHRFLFFFVIYSVPGILGLLLFFGRASDFYRLGVVLGL